MAWPRSRRRRLAAALLLCVACAAGAWGSRAWQPGQYPNPIKSPEACGRGESLGWICDPDRVLDKAEADTIASLLQTISSASGPYARAYCERQGHDGYPVAVAVLKTLGSRFGRAKKVEARYFAEAVYNAWQMEARDCYNGLLLVLASEDREVHFKIGKKLAPALPPGRLDAISQAAKKRVAVGDVSGAIQSAMQEAALALVGLEQPPPLPAGEPPKVSWGFTLFYLGSAGIAFMGVFRCWLWLGRRRSTRRGQA